MKRILMLSLALCMSAGAFAQKKAPVNEANVKKAMKSATTFMYDKVSNRGGFLWSYERDMSRVWGELEAYPTMVWVENSTPDVGHLMLDAYHATGDEYYYEMAVRTANILIRGQLPCGGWGYKFDLAGTESEKRWFETIGKNAWGAPEHSFYYGNATFDDNVTAGAATFLLRIYVEKYDPAFKPALDKAINMVLESQYPIGGWPQRWPLMYNHPDADGTPDYTACITLNDDVTENNIKFLTHVYFMLGEERIREPLMRAMNCIRVLQQGAPAAGWADQYYLDITPAKARDYEPPAISSRKTQHTIELLMDFYRLTGDSKFLNGIPAALDFLQSIALDEQTQQLMGRPAGRGRIMCPRFTKPGTLTPLYLHRKGSHINNGSYYIDQDPTNVIGHYASVVPIPLDKLRKDYETLIKESREEATKDSPLLNDVPFGFPVYFTPAIAKATAEEVSKVLSSLDREGCWPTPLTRRTYPYTGEGDPSDPVPEKYEDTTVHPKSTSSMMADTSDGISTHAFINNMGVLISYLTGKQDSAK